MCQDFTWTFLQENVGIPILGAFLAHLFVYMHIQNLSVNMTNIKVKGKQTQFNFTGISSATQHSKTYTDIIIIWTYPTIQ